LFALKQARDCAARAGARGLDGASAEEETPAVGNVRRILVFACAAVTAAVAAAQAPDADAALAKARDEVRRLGDASAQYEKSLVRAYQDFEKLVAKSRESDMQTQLSAAIATAAQQTAAEVQSGRIDGTQKIKILNDLRPRIVDKLPKAIPESMRSFIAQHVTETVAAGNDATEAASKASADFCGKYLDPKPAPHELWNQVWCKEINAARDYATARAGQATAEDKLARLEHPERFNAAYANTPDGMVFVIGGNYTLGPNEGYPIDNEKRKGNYQVNIKNFYIDKTEVTNKQYHDYLRSLAKAEATLRAPAHWDKSAKEGYSMFPPNEENCPVVGVSYEDAAAYAAWARKRLPTEEEWEVAARGPRGFRYPWGNDYVSNKANDVSGDVGGPANVGSFPGDVSHFGALDMAGNVMEWTSSLERGKIATLKLDSNVNVVIRGGCFNRDKNKCTGVYRWAWPGKTARERNLGFRCAKDSA
jgi:formylglycine-generating enzyme required for sulfatase activity